MRLFGKKSSNPTEPSGSAEAEAEAELRRAVEALGMPTVPDGAPSVPEPPPAAVDLSVAEDLDDAVPVRGETNVPWEDAQDSGPDARSDDPRPEDAPLGDPARRRVRKAPPGATQPARTRSGDGAAPRPRTSARTAGPTRQRRSST